MSKKNPSRASENPEELAKNPLQAILLADSFAQKFRPITLERPKVLLPLANIPMIEYSLSWLESAGVEEVFVFCCAHSNQIVDYLKTTQWLKKRNFSVVTIESHNSISAGDALRLIYDRNVIRGDFVLVSGDTVSNMSLTQAIQEHKERRKKDPLAVMTIIIKRSKPSPLIHQTRLGNDELLMGIDPETRRLLYYEERTDPSKGTITLDKSLLAESSNICLHNDMQDCYIDICSSDVLSLFTDNFDYQHLRRHFVKGLLLDDIMGYKIFTHEIHSSYAARVDNFRSYDTVTRDIIHRWSYPFVPDIQFSEICPLIRLGREGIYKSPTSVHSCSANIGPFALIGSGTTIGDTSIISNSVIGENCSIGSNAIIHGSYIWKNVKIEDNCKIMHGIVCDDVVIKAGATLEPGVILSFKVMIGQQIVVPAYSKVSLLPQPTKQDSDEELEYANDNIEAIDSPAISSVLGVGNKEQNFVSSSSGSECAKDDESGRGYIWSCEGNQEEEWKQSIAPIPVDKISAILSSFHLDPDLSSKSATNHPDVGVLKSDSESLSSNDKAIDVSGSDITAFEKEIEATFMRAVNEVPQVKEEHVVLEIKSLRMSYNVETYDVLGAVFTSILKLAVDTPHGSGAELFHNAREAISRWKGLLKNFHQDVDDEIELILKLEEICSESAKELSPLFSRILHELYQQDVVTERAILDWEAEKSGADEADRIFLKQSEPLLQWLKEAPEESSEEE